MSTVPYRVGKWLPSDQAVLDTWLKNLIEEVDGTEQVDADEEEIDGIEIPKLHPAVQDLKILIDTDGEINMFFHQMFGQIPKKTQYILDPNGKPQVRNYHLMLRLINRIITKAPEYNSYGLVGFPLNAILDWPMGTTGGYAAFLNEKVNSKFKNILNHWGTFLKTQASCYVLSDEGWFSKAALANLEEAEGGLPFHVAYKCNKNAECYGFSSWDDFFTREFRKGVRPIASPDDDKVIANACESAPYNYQYGVKRRDKFWIKAQPYSMSFLLANDSLVGDFVGGTVYQAYLSAFSYHRWHSPVNGSVKKTYVVNGTYYSEAQSEGYDPSGPNLSQQYLTEVATRALIFIQADNPYIGLMCFISVGMAEVSSCEVTVFEGQHVKKGQQIGMFHYGGSSHCLVFRPGVNVTFDLHGQTPGDPHAKNVHVNAKIASVPE